MYLMTSTRCGISAKQLERELGVHYKTAWRMFNKIRNELMTEDEPAKPLKGEVEVDETSWGGKPRRKLKTRDRSAPHSARPSRPSSAWSSAAGGSGCASSPSRRGEPLVEPCGRNVNPDAIMLHRRLARLQAASPRVRGPRVINHSAGVYVDGDVHTNTIEGFFGNLKTGMRGAYKHVSDKWLQSYLDEYAWRHNHRFRGPALDVPRAASERRRSSERGARYPRASRRRRASAAKADEAKRKATDDLRESCQRSAGGGRPDYPDRF